jgi:hypothetical protein
MTQKVQRQNDLATFLAYLQFCRLHPAYHPGWANQFRIFDWIDERRIEMLAEGRPLWVPSMRDFEQAERDCADDLLKKNPTPLQVLHQLTNANT